MPAYEQSMRPLVNFYEQRGRLVTIAAAGSHEESYHHTQFCTPAR
jgi:adenylate kinase family enzyme